MSIIEDLVKALDETGNPVVSVTVPGEDATDSTEGLPLSGVVDAIEDFWAADIVLKDGEYLRVTPHEPEQVDRIVDWPLSLDDVINPLLDKYQEV